MDPGRRIFTLHDDLVKAILIATSPYGIFWRNITGTYKTLDGKRVVSCGLEGTPDVVGFQNETGLWFGFEAKIGHDKLSPKQIQFHKIAKQRGARIFEIRDPYQCVEILKKESRP